MDFLLSIFFLVVKLVRTWKPLTCPRLCVDIKRATEEERCPLAGEGSQRLLAFRGPGYRPKGVSLYICALTHQVGLMCSSNTFTKTGASVESAVHNSQAPCVIGCCSNNRSVEHNACSQASKAGSITTEKRRFRSAARSMRRRALQPLAALHQLVQCMRGPAL